MKRRTIDESFERWWAKTGPHRHYCKETLALVKDYARAAWANGYSLGQRREKAKR